MVLNQGGGGCWKDLEYRGTCVTALMWQTASPSPKSIESEEKRALCWGGKNIEGEGNFNLK